MSLLAIDPGTTESGWVEFSGLTGAVVAHGIERNDDLLYHLSAEKIAIEMQACYGMPVGRDVFETCLWIGRFAEKAGAKYCRKVYRRDVKHLLCNSAKAKDANVRQAIIDRYEPTGGGKTPQIGTKAQPGPLYGVKSHVWAAIGVGLVALEKWEELETF